MTQGMKSDAGDVVAAWARSIKVGTAATHHGLTVFPIVGGSDAARPTLTYQTLQEAIAKGWVTITEQPSATVPELLFTNGGGAMVLVLAGQEIVGGKQNRVVNATFLVAANSSVTLPVTCVEQGRWREVSPSFMPGEVSQPELRRGMNADVAASLRTTGRATADQMSVWDNVARRQAREGHQSPTGALHDLFKARATDLGSYESALPYVEGAFGFVAAIGGRVVGSEIFDQSRTARLLWSGLIRSYALDAVEGQAGVSAESGQAAALLAAPTSARHEVYQSLGLGEDVRIVGNQVVGSALVYERVPIHLSLFQTRDDQMSSTSRITRASTRRSWRRR